MLLVVTGLLALSLVRVLGIDRGFNAEHVLTVDVSLPAARYAEEPVRLAAYDRLIDSLRILPSIQTVTTTSMLPLAGQGQSNFLVAGGSTQPRFQGPSAHFRFVAPELFSTLGITIVRGRSFTERERDPRRPAPVVVSAATATTLWPGQDAIGKRFSRGFAEEQGFEVVGVTPDARLTSIERTPPLMVYAPYWWRSRPSLSLLIRTAGEPTSVLGSVRRSVHAIDPDIAIADARPVEQLVDASVAARRYQMRLFVVFGGVALFIATVGVYAVTAFGVSRRRREMNIRVALGAQASQVRRMVVGQGLSPVLAGVVFGVF